MLTEAYGILHLLSSHLLVWSPKFEDILYLTTKWYGLSWLIKPTQTLDPLSNISSRKFCVKSHVLCTLNTCAQSVVFAENFELIINAQPGCNLDICIEQQNNNNKPLVTA